jgi:hypothetical protein
MKPTNMYRALWPKITHNGRRTRHQDQCPSAVSFTTANPTQSSPAK